MFKDLEGQTEALKLSCIEMTYFMRGAIPYSEFMDLTPGEKRLVAKFLEKRMEIEGKKPNPVY